MTNDNTESMAYDTLMEHGIRPSAQRLAIMGYLLTHHTHPTVEEVYKALCGDIKTLSRTTVYNTLRMFSEQNAAQMITIDDHRVCYDGNTQPHVHFFCKRCGKVYDLFDEIAPMPSQQLIEGNRIDESQLYYKGVCRECLAKEKTVH